VLHLKHPRSRQLADLSLLDLRVAPFESNRLRSDWLLGKARQPVASKAEEYHANATECDQRAAATRDRYIKDQFEELARDWREMAKKRQTHLPRIESGIGLITIPRFARDPPRSLRSLVGTFLKIGCRYPSIPVPRTDGRGRTR
jgi:hypothetical protein